MGAWGYDAMDSDQALDWLGNNVTNHVGEQIVKLLNRFNRTVANKGTNWAVDDYAYELRAASDVVLKLNFFTQFIERGSGATLHSRLADALTTVVNNESWMYGWDNPEAVRKSIEAQISALREDYTPTSLFENTED